MRTMKKLLALLLVLSFATLLLASCQGGNPGEGNTGTSGEETDPVCEEHVDLDEDNYCDICDGMIAEPITFSVTVKDEDGNAMSGLSVSLLQGQEALTSGTTDAAGKVSGSILPGSYMLVIEGLPSGWLCESNNATLKISEENKTFDLTAVDNNPDGTLEKPYFVGTETVTLTFPAGATYHYSCKGSSKYLIVNNEHAKVTYKGEDHLPEGGIIRLLIDAAEDTNTQQIFTVTNTAAGENSIEVFFESIPGTSEMPYVIDSIDQPIAAELANGQTVYYKWVATAAGTLSLSSETAGNYIMMLNVTTMKATAYTDGTETPITLAVSAGDVITVAVACKGADSDSDPDSATVNFTLALS